MRFVNKAFQLVDRIFFVMSVAVLGGMTLAVFFQVIFRYVLKSPLAWTEELARFLFIWMTFVGGYVAARRGQHIGVELVQNLLPKMGKRIMQVLANLISVGFFALVSYYCTSLWDRLSAQLSPALRLPMNIVYLGMILGCIFMALTYLYQAVLYCIPDKKEVEKG